MSTDRTPPPAVAIDVSEPVAELPLCTAHTKDGAKCPAYALPEPFAPFCWRHAEGRDLQTWPEDEDAVTPLDLVLLVAMNLQDWFFALPGGEELRSEIDRELPRFLDNLEAPALSVLWGNDPQAARETAGLLKSFDMAAMVRNMRLATPGERNRYLSDVRRCLAGDLSPAEQKVSDALKAVWPQ